MRFYNLQAAKQHNTMPEPFLNIRKKMRNA
jgi:hypothetical protein